MLSNHPRRPAPQAASPRNLCVGRLPRLPRLCRGASRDPAPITPQAASLRNLCVLRVSALDSSSLGLILNLQLSTFNRVSFPASHLSLSQRSAKSFTIRTSKTPLPQLLYNPHLQAPLGSAGNKGLITPLESALTKNYPVSPLESALTERWGVGPSPAFNIQTFRSGFHSSPLFSYSSKLFCTFLHLPKIQPFYFHAIPHSLRKTPGGWEGQFDAYPSLPSARAESRSQLPLRLRLRELCVLCGLCVNSDSLLNFQLWIEDPDPVGTVNLLCAALPRVTEHTSHCHPRGRQCYHQSETRDIPL